MDEGVAEGRRNWVLAASDTMGWDASEESSVESIIAVSDAVKTSLPPKLSMLSRGSKGLRIVEAPENRALWDKAMGVGTRELSSSLFSGRWVTWVVIVYVVKNLEELQVV